MFAIRCIAFVCFDRSLSSLHIWFVHSLFSFQRSIAHHVLRDCLFIISRLLLSVKPFLKFFQKHYRLAGAWISNFYIISRSKSSVNNFFKSFQSRFWRITSIYYHRSRMLSTTFLSFLQNCGFHVSTRFLWLAFSGVPLYSRNEKRRAPSEGRKREL